MAETGAADAARKAPLDFYQPLDGVADELLRPDGSLRPVWQPMIDHLAGRATEQVAQDFARGDLYLQDAGVYYRQYTGDESTMRGWPLSHIPVIIGESEWNGLAEGIAQRAELLERTMADLYGPADLVRRGILPPQLIARNAEWLRPLVGVKPRSDHFLHFLAFEIGRSPDGSWLVLGDRAQAPSGAGFALENRMATQRVFTDLYTEANVHRLAGFFRTFRNRLTQLRGPEQGQVAILTPGQHTDTYFEHAYIARYLGFLLLESEDLVSVDGKLMVRTINGLEPVSVLWRRLDSRFADPLELDESSALGTPGMVGTLRSGAVTMLNCLGSGVLEARALMAFMPRIAEALLGEPLKLPNIATWWCGQASERAYVSENLERMMIGPALSTHLPFDIDSSTALGGRFRDSARGPVREWLDKNGGALVGQEAVTLSTTPAMIDGKLLPRPMVVRVFAARTAEGWTVMPGGYARIGRTNDPTALAMQNGGSVADVWVVSDAPVEVDTLSGQQPGPFIRRMPGRLPSRAADNLFWLGRYVERADFTARTLRAYHLRLEDNGGTPMPVFDQLGRFLEGRGLYLAQPMPDLFLSLLDSARGCASKVRDRFSDDGWYALDELEAAARDLAGVVAPGDATGRALSQLLRKLAGFAGLVNDNMFRFSGWRFMTMGRALERGVQISDLLSVFAASGVPQGSLDAALEIGDSVMTHRRRYSVQTNRNTVIDLLALDPENPRSVIYQAAVLRDQQGKLPRRTKTSQLTVVGRRILRVHTELSVLTPEELDSAALAKLADDLQAVSDAIHTEYMG
ncbi:circularly permuted type 2 ATP-grasp protein [Mameliella alba]|nr:circularly permuted type 2 ATP-grasp protein [Mameliella alba]MBY6169844.1 circularly permuted type 2 ATP-grasp protein [Mameliella alba]MBY6175179.1 circularly permuted type 2 ATP-grasp protein [Mameliella alba]